MILLDTDSLIALLRKDPASHAAVARWAQEDVLGTASMCIAEALRGEAQPARRLATARRKLQGLVEVPFGPAAARRFARFMHELHRVGRAVLVVDGMIATVVLEAGARLATGNVRHFGRVPGLEVLPR